MTTAYHPLVKRLLDGELTLAELPPELQAEGAAALRLLAADRRPVALPPALEARVMDAVRARAASPSRRVLRWIAEPRELHLRVRPWVFGAGLAAAAALVLLLGGIGVTGSTPRPVAMRAAVPPESAFVRFVLYAPGANQVALAGTFNQWNQAATPLVRSDGVWTVTVALPVGQHQYAFVVDGRWVADPSAPAVGDGFGRRNSVIAVDRSGGRAL